jgi:predicted nucleic acid-binding protein
MTRILSVFKTTKQIMFLIDTNVISVYRKKCRNPRCKQIAATALTYGLILVTRNIDDFAGTGVELLNPFEK